MKKKLIVALLLAALLIFGLCGCEDATVFPENNEHASVVIIAGRHANANMYTQDMLDSIDLEEIVESSISYYMDGERYCAEANIYVISCDGKPSVVEITKDGEEIDLLYGSLYADNVMKSAASIAENVTEFLMSDALIADDKEVDLVAAVSLARDVLRMHPGKENHIVILDTGITTSGSINMLETDIQADSADVVLSGITEAAFPDLEGYKVTFTGVGNVAVGFQEDLSDDEVFKNCLTDFWTTYFKICGATLNGDIIYTYGQGEPMIHNSTSDSGYPYVSNVPFYRTPAPEIEEGEEETTPNAAPPDEKPPVFNETVLGFNGGKATFRNGEASAVNALNNKLAYFEQVLAYDPDAVFYVVGSIAKTDPNRDHELGTLSLERADKVAELLRTILKEKCGIRDEQIVSVAGGLTRFSWRSGVEFPNGATQADDGEQQKNRVVAIIPSIETELQAELKTKLADAGLQTEADKVKVG